MNKFNIFLVWCACCSICVAVAADRPDVVDVGLFSQGKAGEHVPANWKPLTFKRISKHTVYSMVDDNGTSVVKAQSDQSASGLVANVTIDLRDYPILEWRWKIANLVAKGDPHRKEGDDYPARIYIIFGPDQSKLDFADKVARKLSGQDIPHSGLNYIWDNKTPIGAALPNAFSDRLRMFVVQSGGDKLNQWQTEQRNVLEDYRKAFGAEPPLISGIAIMTDTDNTHEHTTAWYGDIRFKKAPR